MKGIALREKTPEDVPALANLMERLPEWFTAEEVETVRAIAAGLPGLAAIDADDTMIGFVLWEQRATELEICWLAVDREMHGHGTGRQMLARVVERARAAGVARIRVQTVAHTTEYEPYARTRAFYEACGFVLDSVEPHGWPDGADKGIYVLPLGATAG